MPPPFPRLQLEALLLPDRRDALVGVGQEDQAEIREDRLGDVERDIAGLVPGREGADLRLAPRVDGALEEADAGVAAAGMAQDKEPAVLLAPRTGRRPDIGGPFEVRQQ